MYLTKCRMCKSPNLYRILDLGACPPADQFLTSEELHTEASYPLELMTCFDCGLFQLSYVVPPEILYCKNYPYEASTTATARAHWKQFADDVSSEQELKPSDLVVDFGSNVGTLLQAFKDNGVRVIGVDPADNMAKTANAAGIQTLSKFFNKDSAREIVLAHGKAAVITGTNVFAHVHDLEDLMMAVRILLSDNGVFIIEVPYLINLLEGMQYDTIYHEHLSYISIKPLVKFLDKFGMEICNIKPQNYHGGSLRIFIRRYTGLPTPIVNEYIENEEKKEIYNLVSLNKFAIAVEENGIALKNLIVELKKENKTIAAVSAPAKGMTLLNYCGLIGMLDFITEKAPLKIGKVTPGTHIPVVDDNYLIEKQPDYALLLAWNFASEIMNNLKDYTGKFIIPIPRPEIRERL